MRAAPVQLLQVVFKKLLVEWDERHAPPDPPNPFTAPFVFDGVDLSTEFSFGELDRDHERGRMYLVSLRLIVDNEPRDDDKNQQFSPYLIDVEARGVVLIPNGAEKLAPPDDLAAVNGASLLWSSIREQIVSASARMMAGQVMLPTMNFHDFAQSTASAAAAKAAQEAAEASPRTKKRVATKAGKPASRSESKE